MVCQRRIDLKNIIIFTEEDQIPMWEKKGAEITGPFFFLDASVCPEMLNMAQIPSKRKREDFAIEFKHYRALLDLEEDWELCETQGVWLRVNPDKHHKLDLQLKSGGCLTTEKMFRDTNEIIESMSQIERSLTEQIQREILFFLVMRHFCRASFGPNNISAEVFRPFYFTDGLLTFHSNRPAKCDDAYYFGTHNPPSSLREAFNRHLAYPHEGLIDYDVVNANVSDLRYANMLITFARNNKEVIDSGCRKNWEDFKTRMDYLYFPGFGVSEQDLV